MYVQFIYVGPHVATYYQNLPQSYLKLHLFQLLKSISELGLKTVQRENPYHIR